MQLDYTKRPTWDKYTTKYRTKEYANTTEVNFRSLGVGSWPYTLRK